MSIFKENVAYRPFTYNWAVEEEKKHRVDMNWHENQIELQDDLRQFSNEGGLATKNVSHEVHKSIVDKLSMLFTEMDVQVGGGYAKLLPYAKNNEIRTLWFTFAGREVTHQRAYALAAETFGYTNSDWARFKDYKAMLDKIDIMSEDLGDLGKPVNFAKQLATVFLGEGISLFGAFACLLNMERFGLMQGFNTINSWSLADEAHHVECNMKIFMDVVTNELEPTDKLELEEYVKSLVKRYTEAEHTFLDLIFEMGNQEDLTCQQAKDFISYLGELRLSQLNLLGDYEVRDNPLEWMDYILSGSSHINFFEQRVSDYSHSGLIGDVDYSKYRKIIEDKKLGLI